MGSRRGRGNKAERGGAAKLGAVALVALATLAPGCIDFDTGRATPPRGSLGREIYTMVCDRVGTQALREDITGASYHDVCHANADGKFADKVDTGKLEPLAEAFDVKGKPVTIEQQEKNRAHRIARIEALARRRDDLIGAFDVAFADAPIPKKDLDNPDPTHSCDAKDPDGQLREQFAETVGRLTDLYNDDTIPHLTRSLARIMGEVEKSPPAQEALAKFDARRGYRPLDVANGVAKPLLAYPRLVEMANALLRLLSSDTDPEDIGRQAAGEPEKKAKDRTAKDKIAGKAHGALTDLMAATREELRTAKVIPTPGALTVTKDTQDPKMSVLSRPRGNLEIARLALLEQDPLFTIGPPRWMVLRDARGVARVARRAGQLPAPFVDAVGGDGLPDVDDLGQFVTTTAGVTAPPPFKTFFADPPGTERDADGRVLASGAPAYETIDISSTFLASLTKDLVPLLDPNVEKKHETLMDLFSGLYVVAGVRDAEPKSERDYDGQKLTYRGIREDASPLVDLIHGIGQVLGDPTTDDTLALLTRLAEDKPEVLARYIGIGFKIKAIADRHPEAKIPDGSTLWDEMLDVVVEIAQKPNLIEDIIRAFGEDATLDIPRSASAYMWNRDHLSYDRNNINGPPFNLTTGNTDTLRTPVDRNRPDTGWNRSAFQRFLQALHDTNGMSTCTKEGAVAHIVWNGIAVDFPSTGSSAICFTLGAPPPPNPMPLCGMFRVKNVAAELVDGVLGTVKLDIRDECMQKLVDSPLTGIIGGADAFLEHVSGITGFNTKPSVPAVNRLVFFDLPYPGHAGDTQNEKARNFFRDLFEPTQTLACPGINYTDRDGAVLNLRKCSGMQGTMRQRDEDALFPIEQLGFIEASKPLARAFQKNDANLQFVKLFDTLHLHWGSAKQSKDECDKALPRTDARWCSQDGAVTYEPLIAEALGTDLFPALHAGTRELAAMRIPHCDRRNKKTGACEISTEWDGVKVLAEAVKSMVDPLRNRGLKQRNGDAGVLRNDGKKNPQVTPIYLLIDALKGFDKRLADHAVTVPGDDRVAQWRRARSQVVDQFFTVEGNGKDSRFANAKIRRMMPILIGAIRSQILANCHDPGAGCAWAKVELPKKAKDMVTGPSFVSLLDVFDSIRSDEAARTELERLAVYLLESATEDASKATLTALVDVLQVFEDDANLTALLRAGADAAGPEVLDADGRVTSRGLLLSGIDVLSRILGEVHDKDGRRLCSKEIDPNRTLQVVLRRFITPPPDGRPPPIDVLIDVVADVNRHKPEMTTKLEPIDYGSIAYEVGDFCAHPSRGLEQVYEALKQATKDL